VKPPYQHRITVEEILNIDGDGTCGDILRAQLAAMTLLVQERERERDMARLKQSEAEAKEQKMYLAFAARKPNPLAPPKKRKRK